MAVRGALYKQSSLIALKGIIPFRYLNSSKKREPTAKEFRKMPLILRFYATTHDSLDQQYRVVIDRSYTVYELALRSENPADRREYKQHR